MGGLDLSLLKPFVQEFMVYNPRRNALLKRGSKNDMVDAHKLSELLRTKLTPAAYHGEVGLLSLGNWRAILSWPAKTRCGDESAKARYRVGVLHVPARGSIAGDIAGSG